MKKIGRTIPKQIQDLVRQRQKGTCAACMERGEHFHHVLAFSLAKQHITASNIVLLCEEHHQLFHLGDPDTYQAVYEYAWFLKNGTIPQNKDLKDIASEVIQALKDRCIEI